MLKLALNRASYCVFRSVDLMYLSRMSVQNYRGIKSLSINFNKDLNIIIGENGAFKSTLIDAIRLLYCIGDVNREIFVRNEDFYIDVSTGKSEDKITIDYEFRGLSEKEKGALYEYIVIKENETYASVSIMYERREDRAPKFSYYTGACIGQKADTGTFEVFQHYYLSALRDSTSDLLNSRRNILGRVIKRAIDGKENEETYKTIIQKANQELLKQDEVINTRKGINNNLNDIHGKIPEIDLHIEQTKLDYIVNVIKPFIPFVNQSEVGLALSQNSLGHNNLIYISTVLSDMNDRVQSDDVIHFALLIEEPEAHLHPQLQLNLYNFLKEKNCPDNCQLFVTTHSPTLTSKVELDNLLIIERGGVKRIGSCFEGREGEGITQNAALLKDEDFKIKKNMLQRYIDVTRSQLFYAKSVLLVEGISEELLVTAFSKVEGFRLEEFDIELVQSGTSFYPFLILFNSTDTNKRLDKKVAVITDDDRFTKSKKSEFSFPELVKDNYKRLHELYIRIESGDECSRIANIEAYRNGNNEIMLCKAFKTLEYEIVLANMPKEKNNIKNNFLVEYLSNIEANKLLEVDGYLNTLGEELNEVERKKVAILIWKLMPGKAEFAQNFSLYIENNIEKARRKFLVPDYIKKALDHLR